MSPPSTTNLCEDHSRLRAGGTAPREAAEPRAHLGPVLECRALLAEISAGLVAFGALRIWLRRPGALPRAPAASGARRCTAAPVPSKRTGPEPPGPFGRRFWLPFAAAAAVLFAALSLLLWNNNRDLRGQLAAERRKAAVLAFRSDPRPHPDGRADLRARQRITLTSAKQRPQPSAHAMYMPQHRAFALIAENLPPVAPGKAYQLWMLPANGGAPIPSATFRPDASGYCGDDARRHAPDSAGKGLCAHRRAGSRQRRAHLPHRPFRHGRIETTATTLLRIHQRCTPAIFPSAPNSKPAALKPIFVSGRRSASASRLLLCAAGTSEPLHIDLRRTRRSSHL